MQFKFVSYPVFTFSHELTVAYKMFFERVYPVRTLLNFVTRKHENLHSFLALDNTATNTSYQFLFWDWLLSSWPFFVHFWNFNTFWPNIFDTSDKTNRGKYKAFRLRVLPGTDKNVYIRKVRFFIKSLFLFPELAISGEWLQRVRSWKLKRQGKRQ